jgi:4-hydroxy-tetrahydrodipicolinate synthase
MPRFGNGVYTVVPTPFTADWSVDLASLERLTEFLLGLEIDGLLILGVLGEAPKLAGAERTQVIKAVMTRVGSALPVIVGTSHASAYGAREFSRAAADLGAAGVMIAPPRLARPDQDVTARYFDEAVEGLAVDVVLQDHPVSSGVVLASDEIADLIRRVPAIQHVKLEDSPSPRKVSELRRVLGDPVKIYGGLGGVFLLEELRAGADGTMTGFAFPEILVEVVRAHQAGDTRKAAEVFYRYLPLIRFEFQDEIGLAVRKRIYRLRGVIGHDAIRPPGVELDDCSAQQLGDLLSWLGLLERV